MYYFIYVYIYLFIYLFIYLSIYLFIYLFIAILFQYVRWYYLFGTLWIIQFIIACQHIVIAGAVSAVYFTRDKDWLNPITSFLILRSIRNLIRYHLGTVALGSAIIAAVQFIRVLIEFLEEQLRTTENKVAQYALKCLQCCFYCVEKVLKYINVNAYIMTG